ncbi:MAG TPA: carboxypeptidase regulatory-like domain-containing protein [Candidatus Babeliales bacterium]|nr:carboxypeptidase regulatory-like domain-containing protein [Candidatus Babeliales bacterium]
MNRTLGGGLPALLLALVALPARGQASLVVGSVRDQHGAVITGATVTAIIPGGQTVTTTTDASGTFALRANGAVSVSIRCRYCRSSVVAVKGDEPVVAIVLRYDALAADSPSSYDLANLPYAHVESSIALTPFSLLSQSTQPYPGSLLSDRGLSPNGSLLIDDGAPNYDIVAGESPYATIPATFEQSVAVRDATNAFAYGDQAAGGTVSLQPFEDGTNPNVATLGSDTIGRLQVGSDASAFAAGSFSNDEESRQRADVFADWPLGAQQSLLVAAGTEQGQNFESAGSSFAGSFSFADATFNAPRALNLSLSAIVDRGDYGLAYNGYPLSTAWSDSSFSAGIHTTGTVSEFADVAVRSSSGFYDTLSQEYGVRLGAALQQTRVDAGVVVNEKYYDLTAGVGAFWIDYSGGIGGESYPSNAALAIPSLNAQLFPKGKWSLQLQGSGSFTLPTFVEQYLVAYGPWATVELQRNSLEAAALTYTDTARVRISFEQALEDVRGAATGSITSTGLSAIWQIAPVLALRAWTMHVTDSVPVYGTTVLPYGGASPTVNALWLTYDGGDAVRADAIYRRDLLDGLPFYHVDGAISGPIADGLRWYAGAEDRMRRTFVDVGLRL